MSTTKVPEVAVAGGVLPTARRIITPVKSASPGLVQLNARLVCVAPEIATPVTAPGGDESGFGDVMVIVFAADAFADAPCQAVVTTR